MEMGREGIQQKHQGRDKREVKERVLKSATEMD
jgi:hypothetical protein